jgi:putative two-component system response regulator
MTGNKNGLRILVVDDILENIQLIADVLKGEGYQISFARSGQQALESVAAMPPDLILLDIMMPDMDGYETCRKLKANPATVKIPVIFVTAMGEVADESQGFEIGAVDYVTKPVSMPILLARVKTHLALYDQQRNTENLVQLRTSELEKSQTAAISMLGEAGHYNDTDTGSHIWRMADYSAAIARSAMWHVDKAAMLKLAAPMHDTGKIGIPDPILKKPAKLDADEWKIMKTHSEIGHSILSKSDSLLFHLAAEVALCHHEKWDGNGYPRGLKEEEIPESARIVAIADVFDALTMKRPYKKAWTIEEAFDEIKKSAGNHFDPALCEDFFRAETEIREIIEKWKTAQK